MNVYLIEDNEQYRGRLRNDLEEYGYNVEISNYFDELEQVDYSKFDIVILDISLPNLDGRNLIKLIKQNSHAVVFMLTSDNSQLTEFDCLKLGADDYIVKPHFMPVIDLKIKQFLNLETEIIEICGHKVNKETLKIDEKINLTAKEYKILMCLNSKRGQTCSNKMILRMLWESDFFVEMGALYTMVYRLRKKLETTDIVISNVTGGYKIDA